MELIRIRGARTHNLQNISLDLPRQKLVVITGLSGSGKSSLAFDTLYAEGQRTLSRARQAGDHHQFLPRQVEADVLQVMRACAADSDQFHVAQFDVPGSRQPGRTC